MDDRRFRTLSLTLRGAYATLLDEADTAGAFRPSAGSTLWESIARALGCSEAEARSLLKSLQEASALEVRAGDVVLFVGTGGGVAGGRPKALLMREARARKASVTAGSGNTAVTEGGHGAGNRSGNGSFGGLQETPANKGVEHGPAAVTGAVTEPVTDPGNGTSSPAPSPPSLPPSPLHLPPSLSPTSPSPPPPSPPGEGAPRGAAGQGGLPGFGTEASAPAKGRRSRAAKGESSPAKPERQPMPFLIGDALAALEDSSAGRFCKGEGRDITAGIAAHVTAAVKAYPDLGEWRTCGEWLAAGGLHTRGTLTLGWAGSVGLRDAMALSREWSRRGRPVLLDAKGFPVVTVAEPAAPDPWAEARRKWEQSQGGAA